MQRNFRTPKGAAPHESAEARAKIRVMESATETNRRFYR